MTVLGPGTDLTQAVALENSFNDPPPDGSIFYGVPVSLTLESANKEPLSTLFNLELEFFGPVTLSIVDNGFEEGCGVAPGAIDPFKEVFIGGTVAGTVCLAVPADDVAAEVLLTTDSIDGDRIYFATTGEAVEVTPDGQDGDSAAQPPSLDETADPGGRTNPHPIGEAITVKVDSIGDGNGFEPQLKEKLSMGLCRVQGDPPNLVAENVRAPSLETKGGGARGKKASGLNTGGIRHSIYDMTDEKLVVIKTAG